MSLDSADRHSLHALRDYAQDRIMRNLRILAARPDPFMRATAEEQVQFWSAIRYKASAHCCWRHRPYTAPQLLVAWATVLVGVVLLVFVGIGWRVLDW